MTIGPRQIIGVSGIDEEADRHAAFMPQRSQRDERSAFRRRLRLTRPACCGTLTGRRCRRPAARPSGRCRASATARLTATVDLPTPPLPLATAMIFFTLGSSMAPWPAGAFGPWPWPCAGAAGGGPARPAPPGFGPAGSRCAVSTTVALSTPGTPEAAFSAACRNGSISRARSRGTAMANCTSPSRAVRPCTSPASTTFRPPTGSRTVRSACRTASTRDSPIA